MIIRALATAMAFAAALTAGGALAQTAVKPAKPQPTPEELKEGLSVTYAYPGDVRMLADAAAALTHRPEPGPPLVGLDYPDYGEGTKVMTSKRSKRVAARIKGYIRFDEAGLWRLQFHNNDGMDVKIGGRRVYIDDSRTPCDTVGWEEVMVPQPGYYEVDILYFQRMASSCAMLRWTKPNGVTEWAPPSVWAYRP